MCVSTFPSWPLAPCLHRGPSEQGPSGHLASLWLPWIVQVLGGDHVAQTDLGVEGGLCWPVLCLILPLPSSLLCPPAPRGDFDPEAQAYSEMGRAKMEWGPGQVWTDLAVSEAPEVRWGQDLQKTPRIPRVVTQGR